MMMMMNIKSTPLERH